MYPEPLVQIVKEAAAAYQSSIDAAVERAFMLWMQVPDSNEWVHVLVKGQIRSMIHDVRHHTNESIRGEAKRNTYTGPAKTGLSEAVTRAATTSVLNSFYIDGRVLGDVLGCELPAIAAREREKGNGHYKNAWMCTMLAGVVPQDKSVREAVSEEKAREVMSLAEKRLQKKGVEVA